MSTSGGCTPRRSPMPAKPKPNGRAGAPVGPRWLRFPRLSPLRAFIGGNLCLALLVYSFDWGWRDPPRPWNEGGRLTLHLGSPRRRGKEADYSETKWEGPLDLDEQVRDRAEQTRAKWLANPNANGGREPGYVLAYLTPDPPYPFQKVQYRDGRDTGIILLIAPFYDLNYFKAEAARALFWRLKGNGHVMMGISSYQEFPGKIVNPYDDRHTTPQDKVVYKAMDGWLHCFREPDKVLPPGVPRLLLSESDFHNAMRRDGGGSLIPWGLPKKWDIIYSNHGGKWNDYARNWTLAKAAFRSLIAQRDLKILITGKEEVPDADLQPYVKNGSIELHLHHVEWRDFLKLIEQSRALIAPNVHDASPRVLAEAMCVNTSLLVNRNIVGGWKYVQPETGEFFETERDVVQAWDRLMEPQRNSLLNPRQWYMERWSQDKAGYLLKAFVDIVVGPQRMYVAETLMQ